MTSCSAKSIFTLARGIIQLLPNLLHVRASNLQYYSSTFKFETIEEEKSYKEEVLWSKEKKLHQITFVFLSPQLKKMFLSPQLKKMFLSPQLKKMFLYPQLKKMFLYPQLKKMFLSKLVFLDLPDLVFTSLLIYNFRIFERRFGSRKFVVCIVTSILIVYYFWAIPVYYKVAYCHWATILA